MQLPSFLGAFWEQVNVLLAQKDVVRALIVFFMLFFWLWSTKDGELSGIKNVFRKMGFWAESVIYMLLSKDNKGIGDKYQIPGSESDPAHVMKKGFQNCSMKRLVFVRHGESDWNNIFNKGKNPMMLVRLVVALIREVLLCFDLDSPFLDSPLNDEGIQQALELRKFIDEDHIGDTPAQKEILAVLRGEKGKSIVVSSTLRRAISTTSLAFWPRIQRTGEKIHLMSCAQEISRNVDTCALSLPQKVPNLPFNRITGHCANISEASYNASQNLGSKSLSFNGKSRLEAFNKWLFESVEDTIIVGGHSLWFQCFFRLYMPYSVVHRAKTEKLTNSGAIAFNIYKLNDSKTYCIDPESMQVVYGGFTKK